MDMTLYGNRFSGHTYKVALFLSLNNIPYDYQTISLSQPRPNRPAFFKENSRFNEVPLLMIDGVAYVQSNAILAHLSQKFKIMDGGANNASVMEWLMWEQSRLGHSLPNLRYELKFKTDADPKVVAWLGARLVDDLDVLDAHLGHAQNFIATKLPTIADCAIAGYLYWLDDAKFEINQWPNVKTWLDRMSQLKYWQHPKDLIA